MVVWRLPRGESLSTPPSRCPKCGKRLKWYDNIPILGWLKLGGKCRFCKEPISIRYPIVETLTALLFVFYYLMYYVVEIGPCAPLPAMRWLDTPGSVFYSAPPAPLFLLHLFLIATLLAASLIDAELTIIPHGIPIWTAIVGLTAHAVFDDPTAAGALNLVTRAQGGLVASPAAALAAGGTAGLLVSLTLWWRGAIKQSFAAGEPLFDGERAELEEENRALKKKGQPIVPLPPDYSPRQIRAEMRHEMAFLLPPMLAAALWWFLTSRVPAIGQFWTSVTQPHWVTGLLGALFGGLIGAAVVWITRILGTLGFGKLAMGMGDVDLMFGVGCVIGAGPATIAFFIAPFFGILIALYLLATRSSRIMPYGPYLGMASAAVLLLYCPIEQWLRPGLAGLGLLARQWIGG